MSALLENHLTFWRAVRDGLADKKPIHEALKAAKAKLLGTPLDRVTVALMRAVQFGGETLWEGMTKHRNLFSRSVQMMVRAGEAGGVLDVITSRIVTGLEDGSFAVPGVDQPAETALVRFWRGFGRLLSSGVPILETFDILHEELNSKDLGDAIQAIRQTVLDGGAMADAMRSFPDLFPEEVCAAVAAGEDGRDLDQQAARIADALEAGDLTSLVAETGSRETREEDAASFKQVNRILLEAIKRRVSDVHLDPLKEGAGRVRIRVDGVLHDGEPVPRGLFAKVVNRIKVMGALDLAERRLPQDGRIELNISGEEIDVRVSTMPTTEGERVVMRLLVPSTVRLDLDGVGLSGDQLEQVRGLCHLQHGLFIANGPTGSGKTTLLYSMLNEIDRDQNCVITIEDPVEFNIDGVAQAAIRSNVGFTFHRAMISALRQAPNVIMVGEIRDLQTAQLCVQAALTGHLVFTTLHASTSPGAIRRLLDMGIAPFLLDSSLVGIVSQVLPRTLCSECKQEAQPNPCSLPPDAAKLLDTMGDATFHGPTGCDHCNHTGYRGRTGIHELLIPDDGVMKAISTSGDVATIRQAALAAGMRPMIQDGLDKAAQGITSVEEVCRVIPRGPNL